MWDYKLVYIHPTDSFYSNVVENWPLGWNLFIKNYELGTYDSEVMYALTIL